jgi:hypothetical protein
MFSGEDEGSGSKTVFLFASFLILAAVVASTASFLEMVYRAWVR